MKHSGGCPGAIFSFGDSFKLGKCRRCVGLHACCPTGASISCNKATGRASRVPAGNTTVKGKSKAMQSPSGIYSLFKMPSVQMWLRNLVDTFTLMRLPGEEGQRVNCRLVTFSRNKGKNLLTFCSHQKTGCPWPSSSERDHKRICNHTSTAAVAIFTKQDFSHTAMEI